MNNKLLLHEKINLDIYIDDSVYIVPCVLVEEIGGDSPEMLAYTLAELGIIGTGNNSKEALESLKGMFINLHALYMKEHCEHFHSSAKELQKLILSLRKVE